MQPREVEKKVYSLALPLAQAGGLSIWDVEFVKEGGDYQLTVYVDREGGVSIDDCEGLSRKMDPILDGREFDELPSYMFCVSSAGLTRRLTKSEHFSACVGKTVELKFYKASDGVKSVVGELMGATERDVSVLVSGGEKTYPKEALAAVRLYIEI